MTPILLLMGLLVLSYAGNFLVARRDLAGAGLPSGVEYVALGFLLGPHALDVFDRDLLESFKPLAQVGLGWLSLLVGLDFARTGGRRAGRIPTALGILSGVVTGTLVALTVWFALTRIRHVPRSIETVVLCGGVGAVCSETARHALRWVVDQKGAKGPLTARLVALAHGDDLVPLVATALLFSLAPMPVRLLDVPPWGWMLFTVGIGMVLGGMTALHIGQELRVDQTWCVLLGTSVLGIGVAARLGVSIVAVLFFMGFATANLSRHRAAIRAMVRPVERAILLPALVLAGAHVDFQVAPGLPWIIAVALTARLVVKLLLGAALRVGTMAGPLLGAGLLSSGALSISVGLAFALRFPGALGGSVLAVAATGCVFGEIVGPLSLRMVLRDAGEIPEATSTSEGAAPP